MICLDDDGPTALAQKLRADEAAVRKIRRIVEGRPAFLESWIVTDNEMDLAVHLGIPVNGTDPGLRWLGFKGEGRRMFARAGVPVPSGVEGVRTIDDVVGAVEQLRATRPELARVVVKHDDSGSGDGNLVLDVAPPRPGGDVGEHVRAQLEAAPPLYLSLLADQSGVVEELVAGERFSSPSAQADIRPDGSVEVIATHEQILGGPDRQAFAGCRFPADPAYAPLLAQ